MNDSLTQVLINYGPFVLLFVVGWFFGSRHERQHLAKLSVEEQSLGDITVSSERFYRPKLAVGSEGELVLGSVVIAQDYFKMIIARVLSLFGKNLTTYETLLDRARREAIVRMRTQAKANGYTHIYGVRLEVTNVNQLGSMVEAIAYGTAVMSIDSVPLEASTHTSITPLSSALPHTII